MGGLSQIHFMNPSLFTQERDECRVFLCQAKERDIPMSWQILSFLVWLALITNAPDPFHLRFYNTLD